MRLTRHTIVDLAGILAGVKINKIKDKDAKAALLKDYLALRKVAKEAEADREEIIRKFQEDWKDELAAVEAYRREKKPVEGHLDYLEAERDANRELRDIFEKEVDIDLATVKVDAISDFSEDITLESIAFLAENGIIGG